MEECIWQTVAAAINRQGEVKADVARFASVPHQTLLHGPRKSSGKADRDSGCQIGEVHRSETTREAHQSERYFSQVGSRPALMRPSA